MRWGRYHTNGGVSAPMVVAGPHTTAQDPSGTPKASKWKFRVPTGKTVAGYVARRMVEGTRQA